MYIRILELFMKDFLKRLIYLGIIESDDFHIRTLKIGINILLYNSLLLQLIVIGLAVFVEGNYGLIYLLGIIPVYSLVFYFNWKNNPAIAFTILFTLGTLTLTYASIRSGEDSYTHIFFAATVISLSILYRKGTFRLYYIGNLLFTVLCFVLVILSFKYDLFESIKEVSNNVAHDRRINIIALFFAVIVFSLLVVISAGRQYNRLYNLNKQNELLLAELNHRVKNNLAIITSLIRLKRDETEESTRQVLTDLESRIKAMALMHDNVYAKNNRQQVNLTEFTNQLLDAICQSYPHDKKIHCVKELDSVDLSFNLALPYSMIVNELIVNSMKHAFRSVENPEIRISCKVNNDSLEFDYMDNGPGIVSENKSTNGLGRELIQSLCEQLDGKYEEIHHERYQFKMNFPLTD